MNGCSYRGYEKRDRAFIITQRDSPDSNVSLTVNGQTKTRGTDYRTGIELDTDGSYKLVVWVPLSATDTVSFELGGNK